MRDAIRSGDASWRYFPVRVSRAPRGPCQLRSPIVRRKQRARLRPIAHCPTRRAPPCLVRRASILANGPPDAACNGGQGFLHASWPWGGLPLLADAQGRQGGRAIALLGGVPQWKTQLCSHVVFDFGANGCILASSLSGTLLLDVRSKPARRWCALLIVFALRVHNECLYANASD
ncbi:hypothetical protein PYCCODRAFT_1436517 [Trametes coccinea BRFM310]|uniref:Uncharacterized protein n=1 Tax=Trametes coccinea (strain BRFM310) TaxID=1353009 RepID=A0A1Y2IMV7_TRAC3|nr:hypothetical protein PYCCODRAFT_1436517 [Trametes coccinea BRFM310]